ncbi:Hypothetical_protein [Hexamita inflata]|uniref:Hypothetical_protein n=1 Tax=Hexamita inflata TaxID=28002 RepID=A0AA86QBU1_9EUKA|nr:Hypothetical protein HINF_LOCUS40872 [Hexamita inflata]
MQQFSLFQQLGPEISSIIYNNMYELVVLKLIKIENEIVLNDVSLRKKSKKQISWSENINAEIKNFKQNFTCYQMCITILQQISSNSSKSMTEHISLILKRPSGVFGLCVFRYPNISQNFFLWSDRDNWIFKILLPPLQQKMRNIQLDD